MNRRTFVKAASVLPLAGAGLLPSGHPNKAGAAQQEADILFKNGLVFDGSGSPPIRGDLAIREDRILEIGPGLQARSAVVVECQGLAIAPGFVDIHGHSDVRVLVDPRAESKVRQGVTTEVVGQDGSSMGPWRTEELPDRRARYDALYGIEVAFDRLGGYFERLESEPASLNLASMVGAGTIRGFVIGEDDRPATAEELKRMQELVAEALSQGAIGLSSGLEYVPGAFADTRELAALCEPLQGTGLPYATHLRNEDDGLLGAIEEAIDIGRRAGVPVQIAHLKAQGVPNWWKAPIALRMIDAAVEAGVDVTFDRYPYVAYATGLSNLFPVWAQDGGTDTFLARLSDPSLAQDIESAVRSKVDQLGSWDSVQITSTASDSLSWAEGQPLGALAAARGMDPYALLVQLMTEDRNGTSMIGFGMSEPNTERILGHPRAMLCSDGSALAITGPLSTGTPHPRSFGSFPRFLGTYVRDRGLLPLETAIAKLTSLPADRLRLSGRGRLSPGFFADVVVFDPATVADRATFEQPHRYPDGIHQVLVNGRFVVRNGEHTGERPGRVLRPGRTRE